MATDESRPRPPAQPPAPVRAGLVAVIVGALVLASVGGWVTATAGGPAPGEEVAGAAPAEQVALEVATDPTSTTTTHDHVTMEGTDDGHGDHAGHDGSTVPGGHPHEGELTAAHVDHAGDPHVDGAPHVGDDHPATGDHGHGTPGTGTMPSSDHHDHGTATTLPTDTDHHHGPTTTVPTTGPTTPTGPIISLDDPRLTEEQRARATALLESTRAALESFPDRAAVEAAGYSWIGDGRGAGGFQHFVKWAYIVDEHELDAAHMESIVMLNNGDGTSTVVSGMYILSLGKTMDDAPDIAGELTPWHDHQNLCFDDRGVLVALAVGGVCPRGTLVPTPPMVHVWREDTPCGPFAPVEGHGGDCGHAH